MKKLIPVLSATLICSALQAQELTLFEELEVENRPSPVRVTSPDQGSAQSNGNPAFTLRSTYRFGDSYSAVLLHRDGTPVQLSWEQGEQARIPGYTGYVVTSEDKGTLTLQQPAGDACIANEDVGVSCSGNNTALLSLVNLNPLETNGTAPMGPLRENPEQAGNALNTEAGQDEAMMDPFAAVAAQGQQLSEEEQAARVQRAQARQDRLRSFEPVRISDEDVPPGMRVVRTPFGDRLVPVRQ